MATDEQWGVMFADGSVRHPWNGRTQRQRAEEATARLGAEYAPDHITLAYRPTRHSAWRRVEP